MLWSFAFASTNQMKQFFITFSSCWFVESIKDKNFSLGIDLPETSNHWISAFLALPKTKPYTPRVIVAILKIKKRDALLLYFLKCFLALLVILLDSLHADNINKLLARYAVEMTQVLIVNVHMPISPATMTAFILHSSYAPTQYPMRC